MHIFYQPAIETNHLIEDESKHAVRVLRLTSGSEFQITDGKGNFYRASITDVDPHQCGFQIIETISVPAKEFSIHLAIAPTKNADRIEWLIEKCVEIGVDKISFIQCKTSERKTINMERIEKIVISAMKQSQKAWLTELSMMVPFNTFINQSNASQKFIAYVDDKNPDQLKNMATPSLDYIIAIGPEGDFSKDELDLAVSLGFKKVGLGPSRLRTETAGVAAVMTLNLINQ